jgi:hypothetical protein
MHLMFLLTSYTHWHYLLFHCSCSAIVTHAEESPIHVDAVMDPLSSIGQRLTPLLVLLQEWIKPSLRICFNPMARVLPFCWPTTWLSSSYVSTCFAWIFEQTCVLPNFKVTQILCDFSADLADRSATEKLLPLCVALQGKSLLPILDDVHILGTDIKVC